MARRRGYGTGWYHQGRTSWGRYKRKFPAREFWCKLLNRACIRPQYGKCGDCPVICKSHKKKLTPKCERCKHKFMCWSGEYDR